MINRYHIQDTLSATIEEYGNSVELSENDAKKLMAAKDSIINELSFRDNDYGVVIKANRRQVFNSAKSEPKGFTWSTSKEFWARMEKETKGNRDNVVFEMSYHHKTTGNYGRSTYVLYKSGNEWRLSYLGNPTTLINGHNSGPVVLKDKPGFRENMELHRVGFEFFFKAMKIKLSDEVMQRLKNGFISLQNTQFAIYVPSIDKTRDLNILKMLYCRWLAGNVLDNRSRMIGELLGVKPVVSSDENMTGLMLKGFSGSKNPTYTVNFYDKELSNRMKKTRGVPEDLKAVLKTCIRVDITLHKRLIEHMASRTLTLVKKRVELKREQNKKVSPHYLSFIKEMEAGNNSSVLVICMIMHILPKNEVFAKFLLRTIICDELMLDKIVSVDKSRLTLDPEQMNEELAEIYQAWKSAKTAEQWQEKKKKLFEKYAKTKSKKTVYRRIEELEGIMGVSMDVPFTFWNQTAAFDGIFGMSAKQLETLSEYNDLETNDPEEELQKLMKVGESLRKGRKKMVKQRKYLAKTFLEPIGVAI